MRMRAVLALIGFGVILLGAMAWVTIASRGLEAMQLKERWERERSRSKAEFQASLGQALWRMDSWFLPVLATESIRPYPQYYPLYRPESLVDIETGKEIHNPRLGVPSPLASSPLPPYIEVFFQYYKGHWFSPQVPMDAGQGNASPMGRDAAERRLSALHALAELKADLSEEDFSQVSDSFTENPSLTMAGWNPLQTEMTPLNERATFSSTGRWEFVRDYLSRLRPVQLDQAADMPLEICQPIDILLPSIYRSPFDKAEEPIEWPTIDEPTSVEVSGMRPLWVFGTDPGRIKLLYVRILRIGEGQAAIYQGFSMDWATLEGDLRSKVKDIFPSARLAPMVSFRAEDRDRMLITIPASLDPGREWEAPTLPKQSGFRGLLLGFSWSMAILVLGAAAFAVHRVLGAAERRMDFAYAITHELRTPLTTLRLSTDMLAGGMLPPSRQAEYFTTLDRETLRLSELVTQVLEYARVEKGQVELRPIDCSAAEALARIRDHFQEMCARSGMTLESSVVGNPQMRAKLDVNLVTCILGCLVANACRYARNAVGGGRIFLTLTPAEHRWILDVIDNGPGIDGVGRHDLFKPFNRAKSSTARSRDGLGLGLTLARKWTQLMGARLELANGRHPAHGGAHFMLTIPVAG